MSNNEEHCGIIAIVVVEDRHVGANEQSVNDRSIFCPPPVNLQNHVAIEKAYTAHAYSHKEVSPNITVIFGMVSVKLVFYFLHFDVSIPDD